MVLPEGSQPRHCLYARAIHRGEEEEPQIPGVGEVGAQKTSLQDSQTAPATPLSPHGAGAKRTSCLCASVLPLGCLVASVRGAHPLLHYPWYFWYSDSTAKPQARSRTPLCWMWWEQGSERGICIQENLPHYLLSMKSLSSGVGWGLGVLGSAPSVPPSTGGCFSQGLGRARG